MNGAEIRAARERRGWTQAELASAVGVGSRTVGAWERGETVPKNRMGKLRQIFEAETVGTATQGDDSELRYRKPEGMSDEQWRQVRSRGQSYIDGLIDSAAEER